MAAQGLEEAERSLAGLSATDREHETLEDQFAYSRTFYDLLGNPQDSFPAIHVAGTSGKGSTTHDMSAVLAGHGFDVGTMTSPHISDVRERAQINLDFPDEAVYVEAAARAVAAGREMDEEGYGWPRFDELFAAASFLICERAGIDYGVIETDMGGRYDATNTIAAPDKFAVITNLGLDHEGALGRTIRDIAWQKAGIIAPGGRAAAFLPADASVRSVLEEEARIKEADLALVDPAQVTGSVTFGPAGVAFDYRSGDLRIPDIHLQTIASYQVMNVALALSGLQRLAERDGFDIDPGQTRQALAEARIPARLELAAINGKNVIIDGSTNPQKLERFVVALRDAGIGRPVWVLGSGAHKDHDAIFSVVGEHAEAIVFSDYDRKEAPHLQGKSADARQLAKRWRRQTDIPCLGSAGNVNEAFAMACEAAADGTPVVVAGSMYMIGEFDRDRAVADTGSAAEPAGKKLHVPSVVPVIEPLTESI
jgi:dihydrofolate synthase/folylpolyglutamate synthase